MYFLYHPIALRSRRTKNLDIGTGPLACLFARTIHSFTCSALLISFTCSSALSHSGRELLGKWVIKCCLKDGLNHSAWQNFTLPPFPAKGLWHLMHLKLDMCHFFGKPPNLFFFFFPNDFRKENDDLNKNGIYRLPKEKCLKWIQ